MISRPCRDDAYFHFYTFDFTGEAFGKGENAFNVCCKRTPRSAKKSTTDGDEIGMENAAYIAKE